MAPSPEDDNTPKAPDKSDKNKCDKVITDDNVKDKEEKVSVMFLFVILHFSRSGFTPLFLKIPSGNYGFLCFLNNLYQ